jgi:hypothetical protein
MVVLVIMQVQGTAREGTHGWLLQTILHWHTGREGGSRRNHAGGLMRARAPARTHATGCSPACHLVQTPYIGTLGRAVRSDITVDGGVERTREDNDMRRSRVLRLGETGNPFCQCDPSSHLEAIVRRRAAIHNGPMLACVRNMSLCWL